MRPRPDWAAAEAAILFQRASFLVSAPTSGVETQRLDGKAMTSAAPSSVAFWTTCSSLSALAKARKIRTAHLASAAVGALCRTTRLTWPWLRSEMVQV